MQWQRFVQPLLQGLPLGVPAQEQGWEAARVGWGQPPDLPGDRQGGAFQINTRSYKLLLCCMSQAQVPAEGGLSSEWSGLHKMLDLYPHNLCSKQRGKAIK